MGAAIYHIKLEQGSTFNLAATYKDSSGSPINLSGYTARMQMRKSIDDASPIIELTTANGRISIDGPTGKVTMTIAAGDTATLDAGDGVYDLELVSGSVVEKLIKGTFTVEREVTR